MIIVNFFGAPSSGKSTKAAEIFSILKTKGIKAELVSEFAKDLNWENNFTALNNQAYIFGEQYYRIDRLKNKVDVIITDSPLLLSIIYNKSTVLGKNFNKVVLDVFNSFKNINFYLERNFTYDTVGRYHTETESNKIAEQIILLLKSNNIKFTKTRDNDIIIKEIFNYLI